MGSASRSALKRAVKHFGEHFFQLWCWLHAVLWCVRCNELLKTCFLFFSSCFVSHVSFYFVLEILRSCISNSNEAIFTEYDFFEGMGRDIDIRVNTFVNFLCQDCLRNLFEFMALVLSWVFLDG